MSCRMSVVRFTVEEGKSYVVLLRNVLDEGDDLERSSRVQTRSWLVQEQKLRAGDELRCNAYTTLLTTRDTFPDWGTNEGVGLSLKTKGSDECLNTLDALKLGDVAMNC